MSLNSRLITFPSPWYDAQVKEVDVDNSSLYPTIDELEKIRSKCEDLYQQQVSLHRAFQRKVNRGESSFFASAMSKGTMTDRLSFLALSVRQAPFHSLHHIRNLVSSAEKKGRREAELSSQHLQDLFIQVLMPKTRLLVSLAKRPVGGQQGTDNTKRLLLWYFEDQIKILYATFVQSLEVGMRDVMAHHKDACLKIAFRLLSEIPEKEKDILGIVISKSGDLSKQIASRVPFMLGLLLQKHSNMRAVLVSEVERYMYRPSMTDSARYYLLIFLTQVSLRKDDFSLAKTLVQIYFGFLQKVLERKSADVDEEEKEKEQQKKKRKKLKKKKGQEKDKSGKVLHLKNKANKVNGKIITLLLTGISRAFPFLSKEDESFFDDKMDTFFQIVFHASFNKACHAMSLMLKVMIARGQVSDKFYQALYYLLLNPELHTSSRQALFLNVLYGAMRHDTSTVRVRAFLKRILQVSMQEHSSLACAALIVVSEVMRVHEDAVLGLRVPDEVMEEKGSEQVNPVNSLPVLPSETKDEREHQLKQLRALGLADDIEEEADQQQGAASAVSSSSSYNPLKENPLRANADRSCLWELSMLIQHVHPSVAAFSNNVLGEQAITYGGDPLLDFALPAFLDRFSYKNPKANPLRKPAEHEEKFSTRRVSYADVEAPVTTSEFAQQDEADVRPDEVFIHRIMRERFMRLQAKAADREDRKRGKDDFENDLDEGSSLSFDGAAMDDELGSGNDDDGDLDMGDGDGMDEEDDDDLEDDFDEAMGSMEEFDDDELDDDDEDEDNYLWDDKDGLSKAFGGDDGGNKSMVEDELLSDAGSDEDFDKKKKKKNKGGSSKFQGKKRRR